MSRAESLRAGGIIVTGQVLVMQSARSSRRKPESLARLKAAARKLFIERGYDATRPQDIAKAAGLGHGTFYLHYPDKRACFLAFIAEARRELDDHIQSRRLQGASLEQSVAAALTAISEYAENQPGVMRAAFTDERMIDAEAACSRSLLAEWGEQWADTVRGVAKTSATCASYDPDVIGQAIAGALHQAGRESHRSPLAREALVKNLTAFISRALKPA
jgi:AcrR family transcriptional regulator